MNPLRYWLAATLASAILGAVQFLVVVMVCASQVDAHFVSDEGYFLSDLGRRSSPLGWLFNSSLAALGVMLIPLFVMFIVIDARQSLILRIAAAFGILSCFGLVGLGLFPVDRAFFLHLLSMVVWVFPMLYAVMAFYVTVVRSVYVGKWFVGINLLLAVLMLIAFFRYSATDLKIIQRMLVVSGMVWVGFMIWFLALEGYQAIAEWEPLARERVDRESQEYYQKLAVKKSSRGDETNAPKSY